MPDIKVSLHDAQMEIFQSTARFKIASCGRRFGKSYLAAWILINQVLDINKILGCIAIFIGVIIVQLIQINTNKENI